MAGGTAFEPFLKHIIMTCNTAVMGCITHTGPVCGAGVGVAVSAFLRLFFNVGIMVAGLAVILRIFFMGGMVEIELTKFGMMAFYTIAGVREGSDMLTHIVFIE